MAEISLLYDAASKIDVRALNELLEKDPFLLERVSFTCNGGKSPLHVAAMKGNLAVVEEMLRRTPDLAEVMDAQQSSPLHIASAKGYADIAKLLASAAPDVCLVRDCQGKNPLHLAAVKGRSDVVAELVRICPLAAEERVDRGQTVLHLCAKHRRVECLKILVGSLSEEFVNAKDDDGNTVMHMVVRDELIEAMELLADSNKVNMNLTDSNGQTAIDILEQTTSKDTTKSEIRTILRRALRRTSGQHKAQPTEWLSKKRDAIMVVAILIATMAFQAGVSPPGSIWQEDPNQDPPGNRPSGLVQPSHKAGESIMAHKHPKYYRSFIRANTVAYVSSLSIILLLISGLPMKRKFFLWFLMVIMWLTVTSIAVTYTIAIAAITPDKDQGALSHVVEVAIAVWCGVMGILFLGNSLRIVDKWLRRRGITMFSLRGCRDLVRVKCKRDANQETA